MSKTWWKIGDWNAICDVCGHKFKASQLQKRWDGLMVCSEDWETRHPQEFIRPIKDMQKLPFTRPRGDMRDAVTGAPTGPFVSGAFCTPFSQQGIADYASADCWRVEFDLGNRLPLNPLGP